MKFAQFQSTYKGSPLEVYEKTGELLEAKYYKNREENSLLRQSLSNIQVEDRNIGHLAKATSDIESILDSVGDQWHYANNALYEAKQRLLGDKALAISMEDYAKSQATKAEMQKRFEENKIGQDALNAYYINEKRYNTKAIELDENGQAINRWHTPTAPQKTDIEKKVLDIVTLLNQHKDSLVVGANAAGSPLYDLYKANPQLEGYVDKYTAKGKTPEAIAEAVNAWIQTTPEIQDYYNYINDAYTFNEFALKDRDGNYIKNENGDIIQRDIKASDFRQLGIDVSDDWQSLTNKVFLPGVNGTITSHVIRSLSPNFKENPAYKELRENGMSDQDALKRLFTTTKTKLETNKIVDFSRTFAFSEFDVDTIKDEGYWFRKNLAQKKLDDAKIHSAMIGKSPLLPQPKFSIDGMMEQRNQLVQARNSKKEGTPEWNQYNAEIRNLDALQKTLRDGYSNNTAEGAEVVDAVYAKIIEKVPEKDKGLFIQHASEIKDYITGKSELLGFTYNTKQGIKGILGTYKTSVQDLLNNARKEFNKGFEKSVQTNGYNLDINTISFLDENNAISEISENLGANILNLGNSFINLGALNKQGQPMTLDDYFKENGQINESNYKAIAEATDHFGKFVIRFIPRKDTIEPLPDDSRLIVEPHPDVKHSVMNSFTNIVANSTTGYSAEVNDWLNTTKSNLIYNNSFEPVYDKLAILESNDGTVAEDIGEVYLPNVPMTAKNPSTIGEFKIVFTPNNQVQLYQITKNNTNPILVATRNSVPELQMYLTQQYYK